MYHDNHQLLEQRIGELHELIRSRFGDEAALVNAFASKYFADVLVEDIADEAVENLYGAIASFWQYVRQRQPSEIRIRVYNPDLEQDGWQSTHTAIEIVNDDMPFLVDSVVAMLNGLDLVVHRLIHPVIAVRRKNGVLQSFASDDAGAGDAVNPESLLHVQVTQLPTSKHEMVKNRLIKVLESVRAAVEDWVPMMTMLDQQIVEIKASSPVEGEELVEGLEFLDWLRNNHFTFLGHREYRFERRDGAVIAHIVDDSNLGILRDVSDESRARHAQPLSPHFASYVNRKELFIISKAWTRSVVHRPVYMDYIGIRRFDENGEVVGERRFLGLLTSTAYGAQPQDIPLLRRKVATVIDRSGFIPGSHNAKSLEHVLDTFPRDELFQLDVDTLEEFAHGILHLEYRQRVRLFMRQDSYGQFASCLVYLPRERHSTELQHRMETVLLRELNGRSIDVQTQISDAPMARAHFIVHAAEGGIPYVDVREVERLLSEATRNWSDELLDTLTDRFGEARGAELHQVYAPGIPSNYSETFSARLAVTDIDRIEQIGDDGIAVNLYRRVDAEPGILNFKVYHVGKPVALSTIIPMLEHMGLVVIAETPFEIRPQGGARYWIHDFLVRIDYDWDIDVGQIRQSFHEVFKRVWIGQVDDDDFNDLVLFGLAWHQIVLMRTYARYLVQANAPFSQRYIERTLTTNPEITGLLIDLFIVRFDPDNRAGAEEREGEIRSEILSRLEDVASLDQDRILRRYLNLIESTLRTNYFQVDASGLPKDYLTLKFDSRKIDELPEPRPWREIFVHSVRVEAVHLRGGPVARGGIRWSDRLEDFRTEVLGLMKAQMVKNAVIVPVGSKGGFVVRQPPATGGRGAQQDEGIACYQTFMSAMLDITDNIVNGELVAPSRVVCIDDPDPYLVVAADKGTATFSDIANDVALTYGHWLGDAFASGGSAGYDHKAMGITARGGWEAVKRHFSETGKDIQKEPFTVVGIGDMGGDVFGNGMLLSEQIQLVGAFNHLHIFVDPDPDPAKSFAERSRLFSSRTPSWDAYDRDALSEGGAVFERSAKSVSLSSQVRNRFGLRNDTLTPNELIRAMLKADVELLWNGGIGTYVKASHESHTEVGDKANDALRINGAEVGAKVVGEGGNLGVTQAGRIEYAWMGGRINTDAIDNSAGVDCSDHEVNIKILLGDIVSAGDLTLKQRDQLLEQMTDEVAELVLRDNYLQTQTLTIEQNRAKPQHDEFVRFMRAIEQTGLLDRKVEALPDDEALTEWRTQDRTFVRPELSVLLAYAKMDIYGALLESDLPDDPDLQHDLLRYFPDAMRETYAPKILTHRLSREIIATQTTNSIVNRAGITFVRRLSEETGHAFADIARCYAVARDSWSLRRIWLAIEELDNKVPTEIQGVMFTETMLLLERVTEWLVRHSDHPVRIGETTNRFLPAVSSLDKALPTTVSKQRKRKLETACKRFEARGIPTETATAVANLRSLSTICDVVQVASDLDVEVTHAAAVFFNLGETIGVEWLRDTFSTQSMDNSWERLAQKSIVDESYQIQSRITASILGQYGNMQPRKAVAAWIQENMSRVARVTSILNDIQNSGIQVDLAMAMVAGRAFHALAEETRMQK